MGPTLRSDDRRFRVTTVAREAQNKGEPIMGERIDELKSKTKQSVGDLTDHDEMEREGEAEAVEAKARREAEGTVDKGVGKAQETWGDVTDDEESEAEGKARQAEGDLKRIG
jgi:uncharacterized protein YjbJ (UPF0337 family)